MNVVFQPWIFESLSNAVTGVVTMRVLRTSTECKNTSLPIISNSSVETDVARRSSLFHAHFIKLADLSSTLVNLNMISKDELVLSLLEIQSDLSITYDTSSNQLLRNISTWYRTLLAHPRCNNLSREFNCYDLLLLFNYFVTVIFPVEH